MRANAANYLFYFSLNPPVESCLLLDFLHLSDKLFRRGPHIGLTAPGGQGQPVRAKFLRLHAGLKKNPVKKTSPVFFFGFFCFFGFFGFYFYFFGSLFFFFFWVFFTQKREFLGVFSFKNTFRCIQT